LPFYRVRPFPREWTAPTGPARAASGSRSAIPPASPCSVSAVRFGIGDHREVIELGNRQAKRVHQSRIHNGQSVKTGSSLALTRRHFGELSDDDLTPACLGRADRDLGFCRSVLGGGGSRVVPVRHHLLDLGLQPLTQWFAFWPTIGGTRPLRPTLACCVRLTPMCLTCRIKGRRRYGDDRRLRGVLLAKPEVAEAFAKRFGGGAAVTLKISRATQRPPLLGGFKFFRS
jgi:hypothetical protein